MIKYDKSIFADNLNYYMNLNGEKRPDIQNVIDVTKTTMSAYCRGQQMPRADKLAILAEHFGINISDLIERKKDSPSTERLSELKLRYIELVKAMPDDLVAQLLAIAEQAARTDG